MISSDGGDTLALAIREGFLILDRPAWFGRKHEVAGVDEIDRANDLAQEDLDRRIAAARQRTHGLFSLVCHDCGDQLPEHRRERGLCVPCAHLRELRDRQWAAGA